MLALGDIGNRAFVGNDVAIVVVDGTRILQNDDFLAVLAPQAVFEILDVSLGLETGEYTLTVDGIDV